MKAHALFFFIMAFVAGLSPALCKEKAPVPNESTYSRQFPTLEERLSFMNWLSRWQEGIHFFRKERCDLEMTFEEGVKFGFNVRF